LFQFTYAFKESCHQVNACIRYYYMDIILSDNYQLPHFLSACMLK